MSERPIIKRREDADNFFLKTPYFALLDIMGVRDLVKNNSHAELVNLYKTLVNFLVDFYAKFHKQEQEAREDRLGEYFHSTGLQAAMLKSPYSVNIHFMHKPRTTS